MGSHRNRICIWSNRDLDQWEKTGQLPKCHEHEHMSRDEAIPLTHTLLYDYQITDKKKGYVYEARFVGPKRGTGNSATYSALVFQEDRDWAIRDSGGINTHQLVSIGT